ncbi:MAG TPA: ABC transporter permease [Bacteroidales bacterium]|nr:ABC transporter permease [Bacteroidales bacterium]
MLKKELWQLIVIHVKELIREPGVIFWGIGFPILMAWGLGIAFNNKPNIRKDVAFIDPSSHSKLMTFLDKHATASWTSDSLRTYNVTVDDKVFGNTTFRFIPVGRELAIQGIKRGKFQVILESRHDSIIYHLDPANPDARSLQLQLSSLLDESKNGHVISRAEIVPMKLQGTRYVDFLVPGLLSLTVMMACMWGISYTIIERRKGNMLRRMVATPMYKGNLLVAHMTARLAMTFVEASLLLLFANLYFDIKVQGSLLALLVVFIAGNVAFTGIAVLFSSRTSKTEIGNAIINFVTMPMMILSGIFFSYQNFPEWTIPIIRKLPLTMVADSFRSIINEGAGIPQVMGNTLMLGSIGLVTFVVGMKVFKWY